MIRIIGLVNDDANSLVTVHRFANLFEEVLLPIMDENHFNTFVENAD